MCKGVVEARDVGRELGVLLCMVSGIWRADEFGMGSMCGGRMPKWKQTRGVHEGAGKWAGKVAG